MGNILKKYRKEGVIEIGSDKRKLDSPTHETTFVGIDTVNQLINVTIMHEAMQGSVMNPHVRTEVVPFANLPTSIRAAGKLFLDAIETERMKLPQYSGATEV